MGGTQRPCVTVPFPHVPRPKRGQADKWGGIKGNGVKNGRAGCSAARCKSQFPWPLPGNEIREEYANQRPKGVYGGIAAPWIDGQCDGVPYMGRMFSQSLCQECKNHTATRAEAVIKSAMAAVPGEYRRPIVKAIMELSAGHPLPGTTLEDTLETINKNLAWLVKGQALTVEQSAAVLTVAMDAYKRAKGE